MREFFRNHQRLAVLIAATLILAVVVGIFAALASGEEAGPAEEALLGTAAMGQEAVSDSTNWLKGLFQYFGNVKALRRENETLKQEKIELDKRLRDVQGLEKENQELRQLLNLMETQPVLDLVAAEIIAKDPSNWYSAFTINKGTDDGVKEGQAVLSANRELVGKVLRVGNNWAEVITILDPDCGVGSMVKRTHDNGVLEGDYALYQKGLCRLGYLSRDVSIEPGDYVETSGLGGVFPRGLLIGRIQEVKEDNTTMSKYAIVTPAASLSTLQQVAVLLNAVEEVVPFYEEITGEEEEEDAASSEEDEEDEEDVPQPTRPPQPTQTARPANTPAPTATSQPEPPRGGTELTE